MRALVTGASGFAGGHLAMACSAAGDDVVGLSRSGRVPNGCGEGWAVDLLDGAAVRAVVRDARPDVIYHLAALSSVERSWQDPARTLSENAATAAGVLEAARDAAPQAPIVWVSSCQVYGSPEALPVDEHAPLAPANPYAVSKTAGELLAASYADAYGLRVIRVRPFNHAGPGQQPVFVMSSIARQAAAGRLSGAEEIEIVTGNPESRRDFTDVRDVVRAYRLLAERAQSGVYNVCSGRSISVSDQISLLRNLLAPVRVRHEISRSPLRPQDVTDLYGSHQRLTAATGWHPEIQLRQTLAETLDWWEEQLVRTASGS